MPDTRPAIHDALRPMDNNQYQILVRLNDIWPRRHWHNTPSGYTGEMVCDAAEKLLNQSQDDPAKQ